MLIQYLFFYFPRTQDEQQSRVANPIDILLLGGLRKPFEFLGFKFGSLRPQRERRWWPAAFDQYVAAVGDVQLAMGFAVLAYGYVSMFEQGLSVYHWWLIVGLVWFSVVANLATTSYLRHYYVNRDPGERWWRGFLLFCLIAMVTVSMVPIYQMKERLADEHDEDIQRKLLTTTNVLCYIPGRGANLDTPQFRSHIALIGIAVVIGLLIIGILKLFERPGSMIFRWRDHYRGEMQQSFFGDGDSIITCIRCEQRHMLLVVRPILAFWLVLRIYADLLNSVLTEVLCTMATLAWVVVRFIDILRLGGTIEADIYNWSFGQIAALAFFAAPLGSLAACFIGSLGRIRYRQIFRLPRFPRIPRPRIWRPRWRFGKKKQPEQQAEIDPEQPPEVVAEPSGSQSEPSPPERSGEGHHPNITETSDEGREERSNPESEEDDPNRIYDLGTYRVLLSPRFVIALPLAGFSNLLYLVLLLVLPKVSDYPLTADVLWRTLFWYVIYQPLLLFAFFLSGMIVEERIVREGRMLCAYRIIGAITAVLSTVAILDTLYGLGGIPMSYIGLGTLGLVLLVYLLYGLVARPGPLAKGKGPSRYPRGGAGGDVEEGQPLLAEPRRSFSDVRIFPVRKQKRWHGPSRRPRNGGRRGGYGTIS